MLQHIDDQKAGGDPRGHIWTAWTGCQRDS
jgi:hypothetical protein